MTLVNPASSIFSTTAPSCAGLPAGRPRRARRFSPPVLVLALFLLVLPLLGAPGALAAEPWQDITPKPKGNLSLPVNVEYSLSSVWSHSQILKFDSDMVPPEKFGQTMAPGALPLAITPDLGWSGQWLDARSLQLFHKKPLPPATDVVYSPASQVKSLKDLPLIRSKKYTPFPFDLKYEPNQVRYDADGTLHYLLYFSNSRVNPDALKKNLKVSSIISGRDKDGKATEELAAVPVLSAAPVKGDDRWHTVEITIRPKTFDPLLMELPQGFAGSDGPVGLARNVRYKVHPTSLLSLSSVSSSQNENPPWERTLRISTSSPVKPQELKRYLTLSPEMDFTVEEEAPGNYIVKGDFSTRPRVAVTVQKGLQNAERTGMMHRDDDHLVTFEDFAPRLALGEQGTLLSPERGLLVPLTSINVNRVQITLRELPENSIPLMAMGFYDDYRARLAREISTRTADVGGVLNRISERSLDLAPLIGGRKGIFFLSVVDASQPDTMPDDSLRGPSKDANRSATGRIKPGGGEDDEDGGDHSDDSSSPRKVRWGQKLVVVSDIGLVARLMPDGLTVWANSLSTAEALRGVTVRIYSGNNILIAEGLTDEQGLWVYKRSEPWDSKLRPALVLASTPAKNSPARATPAGTASQTAPAKTDAAKADAAVTEPAKGDSVKAAPVAGKKPAAPTFLPRGYDDMTYLKLDQDLTRDEAFDTGGKAYLSEGYEAYCYTPRGVYRPGETVPFRALVRDSAMKAPAPFPVSWKIFTPTGRTAGQGLETLSASGGIAFSLPLVPATPTGAYRMELYLPGQENKAPLGSVSFAVEDLAPPRLEITLEPKTKSVTGDDELSVNLEARYLFGTPAAEAGYEVNVQAQPLEFYHPDWKQFTFPPQAERYKSNYYDVKDQNLDEDGKAVFSFTPAQEFGAASQRLVLTFRVKEDGGRLVAKTLALPYYPKPLIIGYALPRQEVTAGSPCQIQVAAVTPEGAPAGVKKLHAAVALEQYYYSRSEKGYAEAVEKKRLTESSVTLNKGTGNLSFTPQAEGNYVISLLDEESRTERQFTVRVWPGLVGSAPGASPLLDRVMLSWSKPRYVPGETAELTVRAPFAGKLLLVVESDREVMRRVETLDKPETVIRFPVTGEMGPNAYCAAWVIRAVKPGEAWSAHRAFGLLPLMLDQAAARLTLALTAPEKALPKTDLPVKIRLTDNKGAPVKGEVTVALIDEGLLSLTNQKTPDPFAFFSSKRAMLSRSYDRYDELMPLSASPPVTLEAGGDDEMEKSDASPVTRKLELLSIVQATLETDADGKAETLLSLPEYSGKGRLMVVAASPAAVGGSAANVAIARAVTVEATTPRMVAPGDTFIVPVVLYASDPAPREAKVTVSVEGPLSVRGNAAFSVKLDKQNPKAAIEVPMLALKESALGVFTLKTEIVGAKEPAFERRLELPVRPPYARVSQAGSGVVRGKAPEEIRLPGGFFPGSQRARLVFSETPAVTLASALEYLSDYPHGCLEQTVSTTWPYIGVPALLRTLNADLADEKALRAALDFGIRRILSMQRQDGGFNMWPGDSAHGGSGYVWGSAYATHLLTEARNMDPTLVPADAFKAAVRRLKIYLSAPLAPKNDPGYGLGYELSARAYLAYVLTLNGEPPLGWMQFLKDQSNTLTESARIFLAGAYALAEGKPDALRRFGTAPCQDMDYGFSHESVVRNEALRLLFWVSVDPFAEESALLAKRLMEFGDRGQMKNTQENALAVLALGRYMEKTAGARQPFTATVERLDKGGPVALGSLASGKTPSFGSDKLLPAGQSAPPPVKVTLKGQGPEPDKATLHYTWTSTGVPLDAPAAKESGITIMRRWTLADESTRAESWTLDKKGARQRNSPEIHVEQGDKITVTLYLEAPNELNNLVITDIAPGGFEIENPSLVPAAEEGSDYGNVPESLQEQWTVINDNPPVAGLVMLNGLRGVRAEMRDDRLILYADTLPEKSAFTYTLRAVTRGDFTLPPLAVEGMYDTSVRAVTLPGKAVVHKKGEPPQGPDKKDE